MPFIEVKLWKGRTRQEKADMIREITRATSGAISCPDEAVQVAVTEYEQDNWGIAGRQASEKE